MISKPFLRGNLFAARFTHLEAERERAVLARALEAE
jgi:hypothetical protein